jgi:hypothetical protein
MTETEQVKYLHELSMKRKPYPEWREARVRLESRPDFNELRRRVREAREPGPVGAADLGELQSRQPMSRAELQEEAEER